MYAHRSLLTLHLLQGLAFITAKPLGREALASRVAARTRSSPSDGEITTATENGSTFTLTYTPSTVTQEIEITMASTTSKVPVGAVIGALAAGAAVAAIPPAVPEIIPEHGGEGEGGEDDDAEEEEEEECPVTTASACSKECMSDWFVSNGQIEATTSCSDLVCKPTIGCDVITATETHNKDRAEAPWQTSNSLPGPAASPEGPPLQLDIDRAQAILAKEFFRLGISGDNQFDSKTEALCEMDASKGY